MTSRTHSVKNTLETTDDSKRIPELDGIRGLAILLVTVFRFTNEFQSTALLAWLPAVWTVAGRGIDLFFVLSGFLITRILLNEKGGRHYFRNFFGRRCLRIFPLYFATLLLLVTVPAAFSTSTVKHPFPEAADFQLYLWTYTSNFKMCWESEWCFGRFEHFWSLAIEEHFYLIWPFFVAAFSVKRLFPVTIVLIGVCAASRIAFALTYQNELAPYVFCFFRFDAILLGALAAQISPNRVDTGKFVFGVIATLFVLLIVGVAAMKPGESFGTVSHTACAVAAAWFILHSLRPSSRWTKQLCRLSVLRTLGKYSYAMYVFQNPLITLVRLIPGAATCYAWVASRNSMAADFGYLIAMFSLTLVVAWLTWHGFEKHILELRRYFVQPSSPSPGSGGERHEKPLSARMTARSFSDDSKSADGRTRPLEEAPYS